jgi:hypothetical protein
VESFAIASVSSGDVFAGVRSTCGAVIDSVELRPNAQPNGPHMSQYWTISAVSSGR